MKHFYAILITIMVVFTAFIASAEEIEIELKGILFSSEPSQISSPWGPLKNNMLLLNKPQRVSLSGNNLNILFGIFYFDEKSATTFDGKLKITNLWTAKTKVQVKMFQDQNTRKWCVTDGFVATTKNDMAVFNGLKISIMGGKENPVMIDGKPFSDSVVEIKNGKVYKISQLNKS
jgi:hypothetical protein